MQNRKCSTTFGLPHYQFLMGIQDDDIRKFYEIEAFEQQWSVPQLSLSRQYNSSLYERLALSRDKDKVLELSTKGQVIEIPKDIIKNPLVLEFLGLEKKVGYTESDLESAIMI